MKSANPSATILEIDTHNYVRFRDLMLERSGLYFPEKKKPDLEAGLQKALAQSDLVPDTYGTYNLNRYYNLLADRTNQTGQVEMSRLINALTIDETYFFRDEAQFDALFTHILPSIIARKRAAAAAVGPDVQPQFRIWSAGCSTGAEPYSLAMLLKELLPDIDRWNILILATDINEDSLTRAYEACYSEWAFRENRAKLFRPIYFTQNPRPKKQTRSRNYCLRDNIRQMVTLASLNLIDYDYPAIHNNTISLDLILCRNVTIYFAEDVTRKIVKQFYKALADGGWLVVGHSEPSLAGYRDFQVRTFAGTLLYQKTGQPTTQPDNWQWSTKTPKDQILTSINSQGMETNWLKNTNETHINPDNALSLTEFSSPDTDPYEVARILLNKGCTDDALTELQRKLAIEPNFAPAHSLLGRAYANMGRWAKARYWCQRALELDSLQAEAYYVLGLIHQHEDELESAIDMLKKAIYLERTEPLPHMILATLYQKTSQINYAQRAFQNAIRILEKWPPTSIVPDSGGATAKHLITTAQQMLNKLGDRNQFHV